MREVSASLRGQSALCRLLSKFSGNPFRLNMCVTGQHPGFAVAADQRDFRHGKSSFKKTRNGFMSEIVERQIGQARS